MVIMEACRICRKRSIICIHCKFNCIWKLFNRVDLNFRIHRLDKPNVDRRTARRELLKLIRAEVLDLSRSARVSISDPDRFYFLFLYQPTYHFNFFFVRLTIIIHSDFNIVWKVGFNNCINSKNNVAWPH